MSVAKDYSVILEIYGGKDIGADGVEGISEIEITHKEPSGNSHISTLYAEYSNDDNAVFSSYTIKALYGTVLSIKAKQSSIHYFKKFVGGVDFISEDTVSLQVREDRTKIKAYFTIDPYQSDKPFIDNNMYEVRTSLHLKWIADNIERENFYGDKTVKLINDIDMSTLPQDVEFSGIATANINTKFEGTFEGQGYEIKNLNINNTTDYTGLIGIVGDNGSVRNLKISGSVEGKKYTGAIVGYNYGNIENVESRVKVIGSDYTGGIVGYSLKDIANAKVIADVSGAEYTGGLVGFTTASISDVVYSGSITGSYYTGGVVGSIVGNISKSIVSGVITGGHYSAGIAGNIKGNISVVSNSASVTGKNYTSGVAGYNYGNIFNATNSGVIKGNDLVGSIAGYSRGDVINVYNTLSSSVSGNEIVGGILGFNFLGTLSDANNRGVVSGLSSIAGLVGENSGTIMNANNTAKVTATQTLSYLGGLAGKNMGVIKRAHNTGHIIGLEAIGGITGINYGAIEDNSYNTGTIEGSQKIGGLIGINHGSLDASYNTGTVNSSDNIDFGDLIGLNYSKNLNIVESRMNRSIKSIGRNAF